MTNIPEGAELIVEDVAQSKYDDYLNQAAAALRTDADAFTYAKLLDISIVYEGQEIQPNGKVGVEIQLKDGKDISNPQVVHFGQKTEVLDAAKTENGVAFATTGFSVYVVVDGGSSDPEARMTVEFYNPTTADVDNPDGTLIASMIVKNSDTLKELETILYDPGIGTIADDELFKGWTFKKDYKTEDVSDAKSIEDIRTWAEAKNITEHETAKVYAMIFKTYSVSFKDEDGATLYGEALIFKSGESVEYTINIPYTPKDQDKDFQGWNVLSGSENVSGFAPYPNETTVKISGNVVFGVNTPKGYWLSFIENGGSYTPPQFIRTDTTDVTVKPDDPSRLGYSFGGWYENADLSGEQFVFGSTINKRVTLYAKWNPVERAGYSVIIWKQRVTDDKNASDAAKKYDVWKVISLEGAVNTTITTVTQTGTNVNNGRGQNKSNIVVNGTEYAEIGFSCARYDQNVKIKPEGTTVLNVYYDRNLITVNFNAGDRYIKDQNSKLETRATFTGLYDAPFDNWPSKTYDRRGRDETDTLWYDGTTILTFIGSYKLPNPSNVTIDLARYNAGNYRIRFYQQDINGEWPAENKPQNTFSTSGNGKWTITDKYAGFYAVYYRYAYDYDYYSEQINYYWTEWQDAGEPDSSGVYQTISSGSWYAIDICYARKKYPINFLDGTYFDGDGNILEEATKNPLRTTEDIYYQADISDYAKGRDKYYTPTAPTGYTFGGWFIDETCTQEAEFDKMPEGGVTVYAKWVQTQYRVFLHPNVPSTDTSLEWAQKDQKTSFRVDYNEKISGGKTIMGMRSDYELIGWYTDEACTKAFNFDAFTLNDTTVTEEYQQTEPTELDKYGNAGSDTTNKDAEKQRFWITRKLNLYAKWRSTLTGAEGITVLYDAVDGTVNGGQTYTDPMYYLDSAQATAFAGAVPTDEKKQFLHWVIQKWDENAENEDGTKGAFVDTDSIAFPGNTFSVFKANARVEDIEPTEDAPAITKKYTVKLRAEYGDKEAPTPTHVWWYQNFGSDTENKENVVKTNSVVDGYDAEGEPIRKELGADENPHINQAIYIKPANTFKRTGYTFLGWARVNAEEVQEKVQDLGEDDLFLVYEEDETGQGSYKDKEGNTVSFIAADEKTPYHDMYAVWGRDEVELTIQKELAGSIEYVEMPSEFKMTVTITDTLKELDELKSLNPDLTFVINGDKSSATVEIGVAAPVSVGEENATSAVLTLLGGMTYKVEEQEYTGFTATYTNNQENTTGIETATTVNVTNTAAKITPAGLDIDTAAAKTALLSLFAFAMMCVLGFSLKRRYVSRR